MAGAPIIARRADAGQEGKEMAKRAPSTVSKEEFEANPDSECVPAWAREWFDEHGIYPSDPSSPLGHLEKGELLGPVLSLQEGQTARGIAERLGVSDGSLRGWNQRNGGRSVPKDRVWELLWGLVGYLLTLYEERVEFDPRTGGEWPEMSPLFHETAEAAHYLMCAYFIPDEDPDAKRQAAAAFLAAAASELPEGRLSALCDFALFELKEACGDGPGGAGHLQKLVAEAERLRRTDAGCADVLLRIREGMSDRAGISFRG